jgi:hypothetical protein
VTDQPFESFEQYTEELAKSMAPDVVESAQLVLAMVTAAFHDEGDDYEVLKTEVRANDDAFDCLVAFSMSTIVVAAAVTGEPPEDVIRTIGQNFATLRAESDKYHQ